jgi:hypothetical protein
LSLTSVTAGTGAPELDAKPPEKQEGNEYDEDPFPHGIHLISNDIEIHFQQTDKLNKSDKT